MRFKRLMMSVSAALLCGVLAAAAANTTFFTSIGDLIFPISPPPRDGTGNPGLIDNMTIGATTPRAGTFTTLGATQVNAALGAYAANPASVASYASYLFSTYQTSMLFSPGGTVAYAYVTLAASPLNGQQACVFSTTAITALYMAANTGQTLANAVTTLAANARACYTYSLSNTTWYRSQ